jgi:hypothetical protein
MYQVRYPQGARKVEYLIYIKVRFQLIANLSIGCDASLNYSLFDQSDFSPALRGRLFFVYEEISNSCCDLSAAYTELS